MSKTEDAIYAVIVAGFIAGIFAHIQVTTRIDATPAGLALYTLNAACHIFSTTQLNSTSYGQMYIKQCYSNVFLLEVSISVISIAIAVTYIRATDHFLFGAILYAMSFVIGFLLLYL